MRFLCIIFLNEEYQGARKYLGIVASEEISLRIFRFFSTDFRVCLKSQHFINIAITVDLEILTIVLNFSKEKNLHNCLYSSP